MGRYDSSEDSTSFVQIQPADLTLSPTGPDADEAKKDKKPGKTFWLGVLFGGLIGLALLVILLLPSQIQKPSAPDIITNQPSSGLPVPPGKQEAPPWQEAQTRKQRTAAQDVLEKLLDSQFQLEEIAVAQWAGEDFARAVDLAHQGDEQYRNQQFEAALVSYEAGLQMMEQLLAQKEQALADTISAGNAKIAEGDSAGATSAFELALAIDPDNSDALRGLQRTKVLNTVMELLANARQLEEMGKVINALDMLREVANLDPARETVGPSISRLQAVLDRQEFKRQMSAGYQSLVSGNYNAAIGAFQAAIKLDPQASEAQEALRQAQDEKNLFAINGHLEKADQLRTNEEWHKALREYDLALKIDANLLIVLQNREETAVRANLDAALQDAITRPERLASEAVWEAAQVLYRTANSIEEPGPRLRRQITSLRQQLQDAITPVVVTFNSDNLSHVTLFKVEQMGKFSTRELELKPGEYVITASREGYRDVRKEFTVAPRIKSLQLAIQCEEQI